jgi:hypothetical protein
MSRPWSSCCSCLTEIDGGRHARGTCWREATDSAPGASLLGYRATVVDSSLGTGLEGGLHRSARKNGWEGSGVARGPAQARQLGMRGAGQQSGARDGWLRGFAPFGCCLAPPRC